MSYVPQAFTYITWNMMDRREKERALGYDHVLRMQNPVWNGITVLLLDFLMTWMMALTRNAHREDVF